MIQKWCLKSARITHNDDKDDDEDNHEEFSVENDDKIKQNKQTNKPQII